MGAHISVGLWFFPAFPNLMGCKCPPEWGISEVNHVNDLRCQRVRERPEAIVLRPCKIIHKNTWNRERQAWRASLLAPLCQHPRL